MRIFWLNFWLVLLVACSPANAAENNTFRAKSKTKLTEGTAFASSVDSLIDLSTFYSVDSTQTYSELQGRLYKDKSRLKQSAVSEDSLGTWFCHTLVHELIPYWYGTPWTFEGYTAIPKKGTVACGYFVSTTLLHMGMPLNRYKLAQQLPVHEAQTLALGETVIPIEGETTRSIIAKLDSTTQNGIYFLGFDQSHVGFLLREKDQLFVIHSNYIGAQGVTVERIAESEAFASYFRFYVVPISSNKMLMKRWLLNETITVVETP